MSRKQFIPALVVMLTLAVALTLVGCGSSSSSGSSSSESSSAAASSAAASSGSSPAAAGQVVDISADPSGGLRFAQSSVTAKAGEVTIDFTNTASVPHDVVIATKSGQVLAKTPEIVASKTTTKVNLAPGTYTFYCSVPGHREAGMEGKLVVSP